MAFDDIVELGFQPSRWSLGWRRFKLVRAMATTRNDGNEDKISKHYEQYLDRLVEVVGAHLSTDSGFLLLDPEVRAVRISRLVQRSLDTENAVRKEVVDVFQRIKATPIWHKKIWPLFKDLYSTATKSLSAHSVRLQRYPTISPELIDEALSTAQRSVILQIVKESVEPAIHNELRGLKRQRREQLFLELSYKN